MKRYYQRVSDKVLMEHLKAKGAVLIEGGEMVRQNNICKTHC